MYKLTEENVKKILHEKNQILQDIRRKRMDIFEMMSDTDSAILSSALPSSEISFLPSGKGNHRDLGDVFLQYRETLRKRNTELGEFLWELSEMEEGIIRAWVCFCALPNPYYGILKSLYVENQLYHTVEQEFGAAHKTFERYRKTAIQKLIQYYESDISVGRLLKAQVQNECRNSANKASDKTIQQLNLFELMEMGVGEC